VRARKQAGRFDGMLRKLHSMRGKPPDIMLERFDVLAREVMSTGSRDTDLGASTLSMERGSRKTFLMSCAEHEELSLAREIGASIEATMASRDSPTGSDFGASMQKVKQPLQLLRMLRRRAARLLRLLRGIVRTLLVYLAHVRRDNSAAIVKRFVHDLGEWAVFKRAINRLYGNIGVLSRCCRAFILNRRRRLTEMNTKWQFTEDYHLCTYFERYAKMVIEEEAGAQARFLLKKGGAEASTLKFADPSKVGWQKLRIPEKEREAVIERYYSAQLQKHIRSKEELYMMMESLLSQAREQRELRSFLEKDPDSGGRTRRLNNSGAEDGGRAALKFWEMSESTVLDLIAIAARELRDVEPFCRHPSNAGPKLDSPLARAEAQGGPHMALTMPTAPVREFGEVDARAPSHVTRTTRESSHAASGVSSLAPAPLRLEPAGLDEIMSRFTPRLCWGGSEGSSQATGTGGPPSTAGASVVGSPL